MTKLLRNNGGRGVDAMADGLHRSPTLDRPRGISVRVEGVSKRFGAVQALRDVVMDIEPGTIHALVGENGAGKSTLGRIIGGAISPDTGRLIVDDQERRFASPRKALADGIALIAQELALLPERSVMENVFLGRLPARLGWVDKERLRGQYDELIERVGFSLDGDAVVGSLRLADQQKVEILRAVARDARLIVMDEPTAGLSHDDAQHLFRIVRDLRAGGTTIVYVSHFLREILALADTITVLRDGAVVETSAAEGETEAGLVRKMIGRSLESAFPTRAPAAQDAPTVLRVSGLGTAGYVADVSLDVRAGEVLGIAGLVGSGRSELALAISGALSRDAGTMELDGRPFAPRSPGEARRRGVVLLPESRKTQGLLLGRSIAENVTLPELGSVSSLGLIRRGRERRVVDELVTRLGVRAPNVDEAVGNLSGGNQQKVLFAKSLLSRPRVLLADEPTRGVDIGAKRAIYELIAELAEEGMAIVLISSELEEVVGLSDRVHVMRAGRIVAHLTGNDISEDMVLEAAFGTGVER